MQLNNIGELVQDVWKQIPDHFPGVCLDEFKILSDHLHGIVVIENKFNPPILNCRDAIHGVRLSINNHIALSLDAINRIPTGLQNPMNTKPPSLGKIIRWFKGRCTHDINQQFPHLHFQWQSRFYDHIIRNEKDLNDIRKYIYYNDLKHL